MASVIWKGTAGLTAQVDTLTPGGTIEASDLFIVTMTGEDGSTAAISVAAGGTTVANVTAAVTAAFNASTNSLFTGITATDSTTHITLTADVAGVPFYAAATTTETGGGAADAQTFVRANSTANSGPNDWNVAANWSNSTIPGPANEDVYFEYSSVSVLYGLNQSSQTLTSLNIGQSYTGCIGTSTAYLRIGTPALDVGFHSGSGSPAGSGRIKVDVGSTACYVRVGNTGSTSADSDLQPLRILGSGIVGATVYAGTVGFATTKATETSDVDLLTVDGDATVSCGKGVTGLSEVNISGGTVHLNSAATAITMTDGALYKWLSGNITSVTVNGGTFYYNGTSVVTTANVRNTGTIHVVGAITITTLNIKNGGTADFRDSLGARTITNCNLYPGGTLFLGGSVTLSNDIVVPDPIAIRTTEP